MVSYGLKKTRVIKGIVVHIICLDASRADNEIFLLLIDERMYGQSKNKSSIIPARNTLI